MAKMWYSRIDFVREISTNRKAVYLNLLFWAQFDFAAHGIDTEQRNSTIGHLREAWEFNHIETPPPRLRASGPNGVGVRDWRKTLER
jgi:hypothetical protein